MVLSTLCSYCLSYSETLESQNQTGNEDDSPSKQQFETHRLIFYFEGESVPLYFLSS